ncbi:MAG: sugar transferase [Candidatus Saccharibacteria bacterium]|nr:sugar transferase [Candidatus Saccharibacteria bacterium]
MTVKKTSSLPVVTIICITYNQEKFIGQAIESFLAQKTKFSIEALIHDDASTDNTASIVADYAKRYPNIIKPLYEKKNQFSSGNDGFINEMFNQARSKYIAVCEGDDYWSDPEKLQRQVDFLDEHPDYAVCFHRGRITFEDESKPDMFFPEKPGARQFTFNQLLKQNFILANSVMYRRQKQTDILPSGALPLDWYAHLYYAQFGKIGYIDKVMSVYRRHRGGIWWESQKDITKIWRKHGIGHLRLFKEMAKHFKDMQSQRIITSHINTMYDNIFNLNNAADVQDNAMQEFPDLATDYTRHLYLRYKKSQDKLETVENNLHAELDLTNQRADLLTQRLKLIEQSRIWKMRSKVARILRR